MAARILNENLGRGLARMGESHTKGLGYLADANDPASLATAYREARVAIKHQAEIEKGVVRSASVLYTDVETGKKKTAVFEPLIDRRSVSLMDEVLAAYRLQASQRGITLPASTGEPVLSAAEKEAAGLMVEQVAGAAGGRGGRAGGGAPAAAGGVGAGGGAGARGAGAGVAGRGGLPAGAPGAQAGGRGNAGPSLPTEFNAEFNGLLGRKMTVLEIRDFLSGEFTPLPIETVMAVLRAREAAGSIKLVPVAK
jgi:hypothetical protein